MSGKSPELVNKTGERTDNTPDPSSVKTARGKALLEDSLKTLIAVSVRGGVWVPDQEAKDIISPRGIYYTQETTYKPGGIRVVRATDYYVRNGEVEIRRFNRSVTESGSADLDALLGVSNPDLAFLVLAGIQRGHGIEAVVEGTGNQAVLRYLEIRSRIKGLLPELAKGTLPQSSWENLGGGFPQQEKNIIPPIQDLLKGSISPNPLNIIKFR